MIMYNESQTLNSYSDTINPLRSFGSAIETTSHFSTVKFFRRKNYPLEPNF